MWTGRLTQTSRGHGTIGPPGMEAHPISITPTLQAWAPTQVQVQALTQLQAQAPTQLLAWVSTLRVWAPTQRLATGASGPTTASPTCTRAAACSE